MDENKKNNMALASMVVGILSIIMACCCCMGLPFGAFAVMFGLLSKIEESFSTNAIVGIITGLIGMALSMLAFLIVVFFLSDFSLTTFLNDFELLLPFGLY